MWFPSPRRTSGPAASPAELDEDAVNELLASLRIRSTVYCHSDMRAPWGFAVKAKDVCAFHLVVDGACWLEVDGTDGPVRLESGDVVLLMTGRSHRLKDDSSSDVEWLDEILTRTLAHRGHLHYGGSGPRTELLCGGFLVEGSQASALLLAIPPVLRIHRNDPAGADWLSVAIHPGRAGSDEGCWRFSPGLRSVVERCVRTTRSELRNASPSVLLLVLIVVIAVRHE